MLLYMLKWNETSFDYKNNLWGYLFGIFCLYISEFKWIGKYFIPTEKN